MAGKGIVGRLGVKVVPDLSKFADELKKKLRRIQKQVGDLDVEVNAEVDVDEESLKKAQEKVRRSDSKMPVEPDLDTGSLTKLKAKLLLNNPKKLKHKNDTERLFLYRNNCVEV